MRSPRSRRRVPVTWTMAPAGRMTTASATSSSAPTSSGTAGSERFSPQYAPWQRRTCSLTSRNMPTSAPCFWPALPRNTTAMTTRRRPITMAAGQLKSMAASSTTSGQPASPAISPLPMTRYIRRWTKTPNCSPSSRPRAAATRTHCSRTSCSGSWPRISCAASLSATWACTSTPCVSSPSSGTMRTPRRARRRRRCATGS